MQKPVLRRGIVVGVSSGVGFLLYRVIVGPTDDALRLAAEVGGVVVGAFLLFVLLVPVVVKARGA